MRIIKVKDYLSLSERASQFIISQVLLKPNSVLGFATGSTPVGTYEFLRHSYEAGKVSFEACTAFNLDEYVGLGEADIQSYAYFMNSHLFNHVNFKPSHHHIPDGMTLDIAAECERYEDKIAEYGGIDLQLLGIGRNGHIGFNEPDIKFEAATHEVTLDEDTLLANARFFKNPEEVPKLAISMGIKTIMHARKIILLASGADKSEAVHQMVCGPVTPALPASVLQLHPDVILIVDEEAGRLLAK